MRGGILLLPALLCLLTGCGSTPWSNYEPVEDLLPVETVGFDFAEGQVEITVSCPGEGGTARLSARGGSLSAAAEALQTRVKTFTGFPAQIIQHECDHLEGVLI